MTVTTTSRAEWERILANVRPSPIYVSGDREWFVDGLGIVRQFVKGATP